MPRAESIPRTDLSLSSRRTPGSRDHQALGGNQTDIKPPQPPQHGGCRLLKKPRASCRRKAHCTEVRSVAAAPPRLLGPRFRGGNEGERGGSLELHAPISLIVFPANAGIQGPRSTGWQPEGHRTTRTSAARSALAFQRKGNELEHRADGTSAALRSAPWQPHHRSSWAPRFPTPRFPGERRDPGAARPWAATKRTSNHHSLHGTKRAAFSTEPEHRTGRKPAALRSAPWQRHHRGS